MSLKTFVGCALLGGALALIPGYGPIAAITFGIGLLTLAPKFSFPGYSHKPWNAPHIHVSSGHHHHHHHGGFWPFHHYHYAPGFMAFKKKTQLSFGGQGLGHGPKVYVKMHPKFH